MTVSDERAEAMALAAKLLDQPWADPDDDLRTLSRQLLRAEERITRLLEDNAGVRSINKLLAEALAEERSNNRAWLKSNSPGGWIDDLRKTAAKGAA
jgi:regulator of sirC expression with transglutaminase-like and TPR domain